MIDKATAPLYRVGDNRRGHITGNVEGIGTQTTDNGGHHVGIGTENIKDIIAFKAIDFRQFYPGKANIQSGTKDAFIGNHKAIISFSP